jgi:hypothetical protein
MKDFLSRIAEVVPKKFRIPSVTALIICAAAILYLFTKAPSDQPVTTDRSDLLPTRKPREATSPDFWNSARVPDPGHDLPIIAIRPEDLGVVASTEPVDHAARIARAISEDDLPAVQSAALSWFEKDPVAARNWLAMQPTYDDLQPAISYIASRVAENGDLETALEWTALLPSGSLRDDTIFDICALALRNGKITASEINLDGLPPDRQAELLSGAAGD